LELSLHDTGQVYEFFTSYMKLQYCVTPCILWTHVRVYPLYIRPMWRDFSFPFLSFYFTVFFFFYSCTYIIIYTYTRNVYYIYYTHLNGRRRQRAADQDPYKRLRRRRLQLHPRASHRGGHTCAVDSLSLYKHIPYTYHTYYYIIFFLFLFYYSFRTHDDNNRRPPRSTEAVVISRWAYYHSRYRPRKLWIRQVTIAEVNSNKSSKYAIIITIIVRCQRSSSEIPRETTATTLHIYFILYPLVLYTRPSLTFPQTSVSHAWYLIKLYTVKPR